MKIMTTILLLALIFGIPTGCRLVPAKPADNVVQTVETVPMSEREKAIIAKLHWLETADAGADAKTALKSDDGQKPELIAFAGRGKSFPGLTREEYQAVEALTTYRYAEGSGDVIYGETHKQLRRQLRDYVSEYNRIIYNDLVRRP